MWIAKLYQFTLSDGTSKYAKSGGWRYGSASKKMLVSAASNVILAKQIDCL